MNNSDLVRVLTAIVGQPDVRLEVLIEKLAPFPFKYDKRIENVIAYLATLLRLVVTTRRSFVTTATLRSVRYNQVASFLVVTLVAVTALSACNAEKGETMTTNNAERIAINSFADPTIAECEKAFGASASMNAPHAYPSTATKEQIESAIGQYWVPQSSPFGLELKARRMGDAASFTQYADSPVEGQRTRVLTIEQGPTNDRIWQLNAKDGYADPVTVGGEPAYVIRGSFVIHARVVNGVETIESCGWDPTEENSLVFVSNGHAVRIAGSPASEFSPDSLKTLADSLLGSARN